MKNYISTLFILLFVVHLFSLKANAQQVNADTYAIKQYFKSSKEANLLLKKVIDPLVVQSQNSMLLLNQVGYNNQINISSNVKNSHTVTQIGNNNEYQFISYYNSSVSNLNIIQQGNSNSLQIYGDNSLIKNLSIIQKTNYKTLVIKNN